MYAQRTCIYTVYYVIIIDFSFIRVKTIEIIMATPWPENNPETLEDLCLKVAAQNIDAFAFKSSEGLYSLKDGISLLHPSLCDKLFQSMYEENPKDLTWLTIFRDTSLTRLNKVNLSWRSISVPDLTFLCKHPIRELDLSHCNLNEEHLQVINELGGTLLSLVIEDAYDLTQHGFCVDYVFQCPNLRKLVIRDAYYEDFRSGGLDAPGDHSVLAAMLCPLKTLTYLDLSCCVVSIEIIESLEKMEHLLSLDLSGVHIETMEDALRKICKIKTLR